MRVLGLFSGIGGFELGFRNAGFTVAGVCEIEPYAQRVLAKHFPEARLYPDIKELTGERLRQDGIEPYVVTGGFPCQDISLAGKGAGLAGDRSGLWFEMHRVIAETRPRWVVCENVAALRSRGLDQVLGSLAQIGYDAEWHCIPASAVGAPHRRDRIWIVAYPARVQPGWAEQRAIGQRAGQGGEPQLGSAPDDGSGAGRALPATGRDSRRVLGAATVSAATRADVADASRNRWQQGLAHSGRSVEGTKEGPQRGLGGSGENQLGDTDQPRLEIRLNGHAGQQPAAIGTGWWQSEPTVGQLVDGLPDGLVRFAGRVATGVPNRVQKLRALGNAVVPQIPEIIANAIRDYEFV